MIFRFKNYNDFLELERIITKTKKNKEN